MFNNKNLKIKNDNSKGNLPAIALRRHEVSPLI